MRSRPFIWVLLCLLCLGGAWLLWPRAANTRTRPSALQKVAAPTVTTVRSTSPAPTPFTILSTNVVKNGKVPSSANPFAWRISNTGKTIGQLVGDRHAILLENALIDTGSPLNFSIPVHLRSQGDPGAYIVQARGPINNAFRAMLAAAGAEIVSYIPNDAYLVRIPAGGASGLAAQSLVQAVIPYEPYYKISSSMPVTVQQKTFSSVPMETRRAAGPSLLTLAIKQAPLPAGTYLTLGLFSDGAAATVAQIEKLGGQIVARDKSPFGPVVRVTPPADWVALAALPGVQIVEPYRQRVHANDLSRATVGVAADTQISSNYLGLTGLNVLVEVNDSGIDATHPDLINRVFGDSMNPFINTLVDTNGHGTHVAGIIAGDGTKSTTVTNAPGSIMPAVSGQFRGMAPLANLLSMDWNDSDQVLQEAAARTNALISNNSWNNGGDTAYDLAAASYDAAVRDALPEVTGSQPVLFVFSAGNAGNGDDTTDPGSGTPDSIESPATAKNVITVGAIQEFRDITNQVTTIAADGTTNTGTPWEPETSTSYRVAGFSSRGNVGIGTEGTYGRFKPDVVAPGTFVVSTRSAQWDITDYFYQSPTNFNVRDLSVVVQADSLGAGHFPRVPINTVQVTIQLFPNARSPVPFPVLPIYFGLVSSPTYPYSAINQVSIPPDGGLTIPAILSSEAFYGFNFAVSNVTSEPINFDIVLDTITTNNPGDYFLVLSNLNQAIGEINPASTGPGPYYRYETGTSMAAADVSGVLALIQDYFTNTLQTTPSPALLKAMLINGARPTGAYDLQVQNNINFEGWGLINLPDSLPAGVTTNVNGAGESMLILDQSPTNALATGDSHTFTVQVSNPLATALPLRITLAWTDPPGNPAAAIKLVNNLDLVVTNFDDPANPVIYYGNDIASGSTFNTPEGTNAPNLDSINNMENVYLPPGAATNFSVTVMGYRVNVNAVTAQTNNVVQDYALVISSGNGQVTNAFTVTDNQIVSNPTADQQITFVTTTNQPLLNQIVGASSPLLGTNNLPVGTNTIWGSNGVVTLGMTNQWHFYVVTNTGMNSDFTNAAFITFIPSTLAIPRTGVFADSTANATRPSADIDLYVAGPNDPNASGLTNLDPTVISNCLAGANGDAASLSRGGTEFVVYTNSVSTAANPGAPSVYYIGVYSEDREAAEYGFIPIFTDIPFSQPGPNGSQIVNGLNVPVDIPDGSPAHPGKGYVFAIALSPMEINRVVVTNIVTHQNYGDLIGTLAHGNSSGASQSIVLNNHDSLFNPPGIYAHIYDDSGRGDIVGSQPSDGPGSLNSFVGQQAVGVWMLTEVDDSLTQTGSVASFNLLIEPHQDLTGGITFTLAGGTWFYTYIDVPAGFTNLSIFATNLPPTSVPPLQLYLDFNVQPGFTNYLFEADLTNSPFGPYPAGADPGNSISYGPPLLPGRYFVGLFNPDTAPHNVELLAVLGGSASAIQPGDYTTNNGPVLLDDAVTNSTIFISSTQQIASLNVGFVVEHPRISDLTFTLISPTGQRILLMENRGGTTTNGAGDVFYTTNIVHASAGGNGAPNTNYINVGQTSGSLTINYDMFTVPDQMTVYYGTDSSNFTTNNALLNITVSYTGTATVNFGPGTSTYVTIIMNQFGNPAGVNGTAWTYTAGGVETNYNYLAFTEDTNLATIPIKFAMPPFDLADFGTNYTLCDFELATNGDYLAPTNIFDDRGGWNLVSNQVVRVGTNLVILTNQVSVVTDPANAQGGSNFLALANGTISRLIPMTPGRQFSLSFMYRGPGIAGWWRGEGNATDSSDPENNGNNGELIGRFNFPAGEVGQAFEFEDAGSEFQFAGTNTYVQIRQRPFLMPANTNGNSDTNLFLVPATSLDVGTGSGFTVEGWINPTNASLPQPLVEWLARVPTNGSDTNLVIAAGPFLNRATGHYYYLLGSTNWTRSELWATQLGGHLATIETANEQNWVYDTFAQYGGTNRNLWIGLTNDPANPTNFVWVGGQTNVIYTNWTAGGPTNCSGTDFYTAILGRTNAFPGLWVLENNSGNDNNGVTCGVSPSNHIYGVVEVEEIQTNGVQLWISVTVTNDITSSNSCLYANLVDTTNGSHIIYSASGLVQSNVYQHVALTYSTNSGLAALYYNGTNVATTNLGVFVPKTTGDVLLGRDMSRTTNNFYGGKMDEMSIYRRCLSASEIAAIYNISALSTNRNIGKFDPSITPALGLAEARVSLGGLTNIILGANNTWQSQSFSFTATTNSLPLQITGMEPGMLLDSFSVAEAPLGNLYYFPEQSLDSLIGTSAYGTWTLQIWDNRAGDFITSGDQLLSWQLQIVLQTNTLPTVALPPEETTTITVPPGQIVYLTVDVPSWANFATNILVSATAPVDLLFNQTNPPTGVTPPDYPLLLNSSGPNAIGLPVLNTIGSTPPLLPGQTYYLGVRNSGPHAVTAVVRVDFDITTLSNGVPLSSVLTTNVTDVDRYFAFDVTGNAYEATFQLLQLSGNADLVVRKGTPLPTLTSSDYGSFNAGNADENIYVLTNSSPVPLSAGRWYLGVFPRDPRPIQYTILAKELDLGASMPTIIPLTNGVPFNFTAGPGAALTNFFLFTVTNTPPAIHFELYNLSGNGDLTVQTNAPPFAPPFFQTSQQPGRSPELIFMATNSALTNLNALWYLGVPNHETNLITYTIVAVLDTNGYFPAFPGAGGAGGGAAGGGGSAAGGGHGTNGTVYHVYNLADSGPGSLRDAVSATNRTVVFDVSGIIKLLSPLVITNSYLTLAGQTAPGGGITVAGWMTSVQYAHDVIIRDLRFRPAGAITNVGVAWANGFEGSPQGELGAGSYFAGGWYINSGSVDILTDAFGSTAYEGTNYLDINGSDPGTISTNVTTVAGQTYNLSFAYTQNPDGRTDGHPTAAVQVLQNSSSLLTLTLTMTTNSWPNLGWATTSVVFTATAPTTQIQFASQTPGAYGVLLDAVSLTTNVAPGAGDSLQFTNVMNVIADHISTAWSTNDLVSVLDSTNVTVQWSIMADSLFKTNNPHGFGSRLRYGSGALSFNHNLYANNYSANPRLGDNLSLDFVNNVIYNWGIHSGYSGTNDLVANPNGLTNQLNYACNYLIAGPDTAIYSTNAAQTNIAFWGGTTNTWIFQTNNVIDSDTNGILNGANTEWGMFTNLYTPFGRPFPLPPVPTDEAFIAYEKVLDFAGVSLFARDWVDADIVTGVRTQTGRIISTPPLGLIGWWPGDGNANDIVGGNNGVAVNITYTNGMVRQAFACNPNNYPPGTYTGVQIPDQPAYVLTNSLTIECWIKPAATQLQEIFWRGDTRGGLDPYFLQMNADGTIGFYIDDSVGGQTFVTTPIANNQWWHVAGTLDGNTGTMSIYTNGVLAAQTITAMRPLGPLDPGSDPAVGIGNLGSGFFWLPFNGDIDEVSLYGRALSAAEIQYIYNAGSAGKHVLSPPPPLDSDQDGLPDYWEITFGTDPFVASNNQLSTNANYIGYTDLEEYLGWLGAPHALTVTNTPVDVDLYRLAGNTGKLTFYVTNAVNGTVYLTNVLGSVTNTGPFSNSIAVFTPATNYSGYASFDFFVTNNDTVAWFGPVPVSVVVSAVPVLPGGIVTLTNLIPYTAPNPTGTNGVDYYRYDVSTNATGVRFEVLNASSNVVLLARYGLPLPSLGNFDYSTSAGFGTNGLILVWTNSTPVPLTSGWWYLAVSNASGGLVTYTMLVTELTNTAPTPPILPFLPDLTILGGTTVTVTNTATDTNAGAVLVYTLVNPPVWAAIDGNGIITLTPTLADAPTNAVITTIVTDTFTALSASNSFLVVVVTTNGLPAFPGAEGAGGLAIGGRGGDVYHVVNLNDSGPGSLRYGVQTTAGSRTIVFDVSGTITLLSNLKINKPYLSIAGQTAPGDGIALRGWLTSVQKTHDVQVRFLRCRPGDLNCPVFQDDSFHFDYAMNSIADHISASWSIDEALSTTDSTNITVQWSMIAEPLNNSCHLNDSGPGTQLHGYGSLIRYGYGAVSYHHNLYADNYSRNPRPGDNIQLDFINNVVFNWGIFAGYNEDDSADNPGGYTNSLDCIGNYYIAGTNTTANPNIAFRSGVPDPTFTQIYQSGNFIDNNPFGPLNGIDTGWGMFSGLYTPLGSQLVLPEISVTITNAPQAYEQVLAFAGASVAGASPAGISLARDAVDTNLVTGVRYKNGFIIDTEAQVGGWPVLNSGPLPVDTDGDGMPDYWEITLGMNPLVPNNNHPNPDGYTDLEHYLNWLAAPHALTVTNTPVDVDLYAIAGRSGNLGFSVANGTNGTVTLTNTIATFTPLNDYFGFASFSFTVTNRDTAVSFGPVTVSVMVSATNIVTTGGITTLTNGVPQTNSIPSGGFAYYSVTVPTNADFATNILLFATAPVKVWFDTNNPPTTNLLLLPDVAYPGGTNGSAVLSTNTTPPLVPGSTYYLGVENTNSFAVTFGIEVDFHLLSGSVTGAITDLTITATNIDGTNGFLLQWQGPTNFQYEIQWTTNLAPVVWNTVLNPVINVVVTTTNGHFSFFDDGTLTGGFGPMKFYRVLGGLNLGPIPGPGPTTNTVLAGAMSQAVVTVPANALWASNVLLSATGPLNVWFNQTNPPAGNTNAGDFLMLSATTAGAFVLTSNSVPPLVPGTNYYLGFQNPGASNVTFVFQVAFGFAPTNAVSNFSIAATNGGIWLKWNGLTNYQYQVQWTTNLLPPAAWNTISNIVLTSTTGVFTFFDDGSLTGGFGPMKFYRLIAWPFMTPIPQTLSISSVTVTSIDGTNDLILRWSAPTNYQYGIQWTTNLSLSFSNWVIIASPVLTLTNGVYTFIDNGQTGPPASAKFFRIFDY